MAIVQTKYLFTARMDVEPEKEDLFNEVYDEEHIPYFQRCRAFLR